MFPGSNIVPPEDDDNIPKRMTEQLEVDIEEIRDFIKWWRNNLHNLDYPKKGEALEKVFGKYKNRDK